MRRLVRSSLVLAGWLGLCLPAAGQTPSSHADEAHVQVFSQVSRSVVAVDMLFAFEVEVYASPATAAAAARVAEAFRAARFDSLGDGLELAQQDPMLTRSEAKGGAPTVLMRRFLFRISRAGTHTLPSLRFQLGEQRFATSPHLVSAYRVERDFFDAGASVFPVMTEYADERRGRHYVRVGSAFLVTTDAVVTSLHVVLDAQTVRLKLPGGQELSTRKVWAVDPVRDIAVLHVDRRAIVEAGLKPLPLAPVVGEVEQPLQGPPAEAVTFTYGWPGGVQRSTAGVRYRGLTLQPDDFVWISGNPVRPGDSGGPLLDRRGRVLGVVTSGAIYSGRAEAMREDVCIALDPRPALALRRQADRPISLRKLMRDPAFAQDPNVQAIRLTTLLTSGPRRVPDRDAALARLDAAPVRTPNNARLHFLRGIIYHMLGTTTDAAEAFRTSLEAHDGHFLAAYMLGMHHIRRREYAAAERFFRHARRYAPAAHIAAYGLARALMGRLRYKEAVPLLHTVIAHDAGYAPAYFDLALCALALDDEPRARQLLDKLQDLNPASAQRLHRILRNPVLQPRVLNELPRASVRRQEPDS